ncbi:MAG: hypothetical protein NTX12_07555, partial [Actinobacteria bacterium]|nr:hypothetical protein [Actinomycetota bacterium]
KVQGSIDTLTSTPLTDNSVTLKWTVRNAPSQVRVTLPGQASESFPGTNGEKVVTLPAGVREFLAKVETVEADGSISSTKEILLTFPITKLTSWCNPTGTNLGTKAPFMGGLYTRGANKTNADLVDLVINIPSSQEGSCIYIEFSPADSPTVAYIGRLGAMPRTGMDVFSVPRSFGTTGTLRLAYVDQNGNFSGIFSYFFPKGSFNTNGTADYGTNLLNETDLQPELVGKVQKSLLIDRTVAPDLLALGNLKDAIAKVDEEAAKVKADFDSALALQRQTSESLQKQIEELKRTLSTKSTITCVKGKVSQKVTAVIPSCPAGYSVKK